MAANVDRESLVNWDAISATAEVIGAVGMLASLIYLAIQIRHNSSSVDASTEDGVVSGFNEINLIIGADSKLAALFMKGLETPDDLNNDEATQFSFLFSSYINQYSRLCILYLKGSFPEDRWETYARELAYLISTPGGAQWKAGNANFDYLWKAVESIPSAEGIDMSLTRRHSNDA